MQLALAEARKGWGRTRPNPNVGCVILSPDGSLVSAGYHERVGEAHAEINALKKAPPERLHGATVVVTLEPCAHEGRTGSCAKALAQLPIREVIYGLVDPNPLVSGKGLEILTAAGKIVTSLKESLRHGEEELLASTKAKLEEVAEHFLWNQRQKLPFVALKVATTKDGFISVANAQTKWITGEEAREGVHRLRAGFAAMLVGKNTFIADNPSLNIRHPQFADLKNKVIVLDSKGSALPLLRESNLYKTHAPEDIYWVVAPEWVAPNAEAAGQGAVKQMARDLGIHLVPGPIEEALPHLYKVGIDSIMVEGGAEVLNYFVNKKLAQRLYHFVAPFNGENGLKWQAPVELRNRVELSFGNDVLITGKL